MAFTVTTGTMTVFGNKRRVNGTYASSGGATGGAITTGLTNIESFSATSATGTPSTQVAISGGTATLTTTANQTGVWSAEGY